MERNYWQEYWDNYYKFMVVYLGELQNVYPDADVKSEYLEIADLFEPSIRPEYYDYNDVYDDEGNDPPLPFTQPSGMQSPAPFTHPGVGQAPTPFISPGGGQFTINSCRRMAIVRIVMRRGLFNPSKFFMVVDRADRRSIQGFRIACEGGRIRFVPMAVEYRNINLIECAF